MKAIPRFLMLIFTFLMLLSCSKSTQTIIDQPNPVTPPQLTQDKLSLPDEGVERKAQHASDAPLFHCYASYESTSSTGSDYNTSLIEDIATTDMCIEPDPPNEECDDKMNYILVVDTKIAPCENQANANGVDKAHLYSMDDAENTTVTHVVSWGMYSSGSYSITADDLEDPEGCDIVEKGVWYTDKCYSIIADNYQPVIKIFEHTLGDDMDDVPPNVRTIINEDISGDAGGTFTSLAGVAGCFFDGTDYLIAVCDPDGGWLRVWDDSVNAYGRAPNDEVYYHDFGNDRPVDCCIAWDYTGCWIYVAVENATDRDNDYICVFEVDDPGDDFNDYIDLGNARYLDSSDSTFPRIKSIAVHEHWDHWGFRVHVLTDDTTDYWGFRLYQLDFPYGVGANSKRSYDSVWDIKPSQNPYQPEGLGVGLANYTDEYFDGYYYYIGDRDPDVEKAYDTQAGQNIFIFQNGDAD